MLAKLMTVYILYDLLIAKLEACGLGKTSLNWLRDYLSNPKQRTRIGSTFSDWWDVICGIPQGSVLGPLLFNILCNFGDVSTISCRGKTLGDILHDLKFNLGHILKMVQSKLIKTKF